MGRQEYVKQDWQGHGAYERLKLELNRIGNLLNNIRLNGNDAEVGPTGIDLTVDTADDFPWGKMANGYTIAASMVTLVNIELHHGSDWYTLADVELTIPTDGARYYIGCEYDGDTLTIPSPSTTKTTFKSDSTAFRTWFWAFESTGAAVMVRRGYEGIPTLDASWGPPT